LGVFQRLPQERTKLIGFQRLPQERNINDSTHNNTTTFQRLPQERTKLIG
jgi:hypothetical protein